MVVTNNITEIKVSRKVAHHLKVVIFLLTTLQQTNALTTNMWNDAPSLTTLHESARAATPREVHFITTPGTHQFITMFAFCLHNYSILKYWLKFFPTLTPKVFCSLCNR